jgi:hypothetical protein
VTLVARSGLPLLAAVAAAGAVHGIAVLAHGRHPRISPQAEAAGSLVALTALALAGLPYGARAAFRLLRGAPPRVAVPAVVFLCIPAMVLGAFAAWFLAAVLGAF